MTLTTPICGVKNAECFLLAEQTILLGKHWGRTDLLSGATRGQWCCICRNNLLQDTGEIDGGNVYTVNDLFSEKNGQTFFVL